MGISEKIKRMGLSKAYDYLDKDPDANIPRLLDWVDKLDRNDSLASQRKVFHEVVDNPDNNWYRLIRSFWTDIDAGVRKALFENLILNAILMDPTSACNLHCTGCWAAEYGNKLNMDFATLDSIIEQGKALGVYVYIYSGGEPLVRKRDLIALCNKHSDCEFLAFTNGTLIDEEFAEDMLRVKNFIPAISVEGFEADTDFRRGAGTYRAVERAMRILKERKLPFGLSCCYTSKNVDVIGSERYFDQMVDWGAKFCWFFTYMPVGVDAVPALMATAQQRAFMYQQVRAFRKTKPLFTLDFWNDGEYVNGCIAGGRCYLHINAGGDIDEDEHDSKIACTELTVIKRLTKEELFLHGLAYMVDHPRRVWSSHVAANRAMANCGYAVVRGKDPVATGRLGDILAFAKEAPDSESIVQVAVGQIDGVTLLPDVWYGVDLTRRTVN